jgi:hypothetical protein
MVQKLLTEEDRKTDLLNLLNANNVSLELFPYDWLCTTDFFRAPASTKFHAAYPGGLYDHCRNVVGKLMEFSEKNITEPWERPESPVIIGMLHDVTKLGLYTLSDPNAESLAYTKNPMYSGFGGHGYDSMCKVEQHMELTEEERLCIRFHMGAYETDQWEGYEAAIKKYQNVLWTNTADMIASKLMED